MRAVRIHDYGSEEVLRYEEVPTPVPAPSEVLVKIEAAGVQRADLYQREGRPYRNWTAGLPMIPGLEFAGTVAAVGEQAQGYRVGDRVVGNPVAGSYAEYIAVEPAYVRKIPDGVSFLQAAGARVMFLVAWFGLRQEAVVKPGDTVLVHSGGSVLGTGAIQVAKYAGARVLATCGSDEKCRKAKELGADETINYNTQDFPTEVTRLTNGRGVDVVWEPLGADIYVKSLGILAPGGVLLSVGRAAGPVPEPAPDPPPGRRIAGFTLYTVMPPHGNGLDELIKVLELVREKQFQVVIDKVFPLSQAKEAHRYLEDRKNFGKVMLVP